MDFRVSSKAGPTWGKSMLPHKAASLLFQLNPCAFCWMQERFPQLTAMPTYPKNEVFGQSAGRHSSLLKSLPWTSCSDHVTGCPLDVIPQYSTSEAVKKVPSWLLCTTTPDEDNSLAHVPECRVYLLTADTMQKQTEQEHDHKNHTSFLGTKASYPQKYHFQVPRQNKFYSIKQKHFTV